MYAQFSPTLDDFYVEELRIAFAHPADPPARGSAPPEMRPELVLTRTVPGQAPKSVRAPGALFPLARAVQLARAALAESGLDAARMAVKEIASGRARLWPVQVPRTQLVQLQVVPGGVDVLSLLSTK